LESAEALLSIGGFVLLQSLLDIVQAVAEGVVEQDGQFACGRDVGDLGATGGTQPPVKAAERQVLAACQDSRDDAEDLPGAAPKPLFASPPLPLWRRREELNQAVERFVVGQ
jgi:hypothetical protein